jgi:hypothetical protein
MALESDRANALRTYLSELRSDRVVMVEEDVAVDPRAVGKSLHPELLKSEKCIAYLGANAVTGLHVPRGPRCCRRDAAIACGGLPPIDLVVPEVVSVWIPNATPEGTFRSGFEATVGQAEDEEAQTRLSLAASLGLDATNGTWWVLGACHGLLGDSVESAWAAEREFLMDSLGLDRRVHEVARLVRVRRGVPVWPLAPLQSKLAKQMVSTWPPARVWFEFADGCERLGSSAQKVGAAYRHAGQLIWGTAET